MIIPGGVPTRLAECRPWAATRRSDHAEEAGYERDAGGVPSAVLAGLTAISAKPGVTDINRDPATALGTVVLALTRGIALARAGHRSILDVAPGPLLLPVLPSPSTDASPICYTRAGSSATLRG
jgi:hypothetical protein